MEVEREDPGIRRAEATMLGEGAVAQVFALKALGWGAKRISLETGVSRNTVRDWLRAGESRRYGGDEGRPGVLAPHRDWLRHRFHGGVRNADVLRQELAARGVSVSLRTVEREVKPYRQAWERAQKATMRFETPPGKQLQVDFGEKWLLIGGERQKRYLFVATLGFSRRCYIEIFGGLRQRDWIMGMEHAFRYFDGAPEELLTDNAKPLVLGRKGGRPQFHPEFQAFCRHWAVLPRACQPFRARTKGKVENGVGYAKGNALGRLEWASDEALDEHLTWWMREVADVRIHGTTRERPIDRFELEKAALKHIGNHPSYLRVRHFTRKVASDGRIDVDTNHYSVPPQYVGVTLEVRVEGEDLQVISQGRVVAEHVVHPGRHQVVEDPGHLEGLLSGTKQPVSPSGIRRPLAHYAAIVGGEAW